MGAFVIGLKLVVPIIKLAVNFYRGWCQKLLACTSFNFFCESWANKPAAERNSKLVTLISFFILRLIGYPVYGRSDKVNN
ncbi:hypothetical protein, partial [Mucilaginibacter humi]|uniref:hypothetical protein n=1 Tax=Mucilaginibacter humi TaxID=2732510 RepID=UPI001C2E108F